MPAPLFLLLLALVKLSAQELVEIGAGVATLSYPDYIGSRSTRFITVPYPYITYKSDKLEISRSGIRTKIFDLNNLEIDLSLGGSLPANSSNNSKREGMEDLELIFEIGPKLIYTLYQTPRNKLLFELPARLVYATDFRSFDSHGYIISPEFIYRHHLKAFYFSLGTAALYGSESYHDYFYQVDPKDVRANRSAYDAKAGFGGFRNKAALNYTKKSWRLGVFFSHYYLNNASFRDSPLVESRGATFVGTSLSYIFYTQRKFSEYF